MRRTFRLWILLCAAAGGCVVPVAPEFQDEPNYPPFIESAMPLGNEVVTGPPDNPGLSFSVTVGDPNLHDTLFARFIFDYPKLDLAKSKVAGDTIRLLPNGQVVRLLGPFVPSCFLHGIARGPGPHRLMLVVSDRDYLNPDRDSVPSTAPLDAVPEGALVARTSWTVNMECQ